MDDDFWAEKIRTCLMAMLRCTDVKIERDTIARAWTVTARWADEDMSVRLVVPQIVLRDMKNGAITGMAESIRALRSIELEKRRKTNMSLLGVEMLSSAYAHTVADPGAGVFAGGPGPLMPQRISFPTITNISATTRMKLEESDVRSLYEIYAVEKDTETILGPFTLVAKSVEIAKIELFRSESGLLNGAVEDYAVFVRLVGTFATEGE